MDAAAVAARAVQEALDPGAVADRAVATAKTLPAPKRTTMQRGRSGTVSWDPNQHKRDMQGRFAAGGGGPKAEQQRQLHKQGLYNGQIDAIHGPQTQAAIKALQTKYGIKPTGKVDAETAAVMAAPPPKDAATVKADDAKAAAAKAPKSSKGKGKSKTGKTKRTGRSHGGSASSPGSANWQGKLSPTGVLRMGDGVHTKNGKDAHRGAADVQLMQAKLEQLGFDLGDAGLDGKFGKATAEAVKAFQRAYGLTPDGVVGRHTKLMLNLLSDIEGQNKDGGLSLDEMALSRQSKGSGGKRTQLAQARQLGVTEAAIEATRRGLEQLRT